jgi:hypothetical protein
MLTCDLVVLSAHAVHLRIGTSALSAPVAALVRGDACSEPLRLVHEQAAHAEEWLRTVAPPPEALPHGATVRAAFAAFDSDHFFSFLIGSALLERLLNELAGSKSGGSALLKDLIVHPEVASRLGVASVETLLALFSPTALNLRNLVVRSPSPPAARLPRLPCCGLRRATCCRCR